MKRFHLDPGMTNMRGVFYPKGHMVLMFPTAQDALHAAELLRQDGVAENDLCLADPGEFEAQVADASDDDDDLLLPSVGTEGETARRFRQLARQGHHALIVHAAAGLSSDHVLEVLRDTHISYGQRYRFLVIEDLV
ncbi:RNA-binding protein [Ramlibacter sp. PS3R-8]|uniref:RNA-binding protein n=1 Tax=Ramlibacter sp. PS3R-8 TaxID=3133437 RepID=UPI0030B54167